MTPPKDPQNPRFKSRHSSRPSMDMADALLKTELIDNGDGRCKYKDYLHERQTDLSIAERAGCNVSFVSKTRREKYGELVPQQSEEARAARRKKPFTYPDAGAPTPQESAPAPQQNIGTTTELHRLVERLARIEHQNRDVLAYLRVLYTAWKPADAPERILDLLIDDLARPAA